MIGKEPTPLTNQNNIFFKNATMRNESTKIEFSEPRMRLRNFCILLLKSIRRNTRFNQIEEHRSKVYKTSHRQVFHLDSKSQICHKLILQVISHQIKDNVHNHHGSIGLFKVRPVGNFGFGCFGFFGCFFFFCEQESRHKDLASNLNERSLPILSCFDQVIIIFLPFYFLQQLCTWFRYLFIPKNLSVLSLFCFLFFLFSIYDFFSLFFFFLSFLINI